MIHIIIGTKAQLIKMAPVMKVLKDRNIPYNFISTGQHRATMDEILLNFGLKAPNKILYKGRDITSVPQMIVWAIRLSIKSLFKKKEVFLGDEKGIVLVHGDTFSTLIGSVMAKLAGLKVGHVESGLRSFNLFHPFPEELTRLLTFRLSDKMFCPNVWATGNVRKYKADKINTELNTLSDSLRYALISTQDIGINNIPDEAFGVVTLHRFENINSQEALSRVIEIVKEISKKKKLVFILHQPTLIRLKESHLYNDLDKNKNITLLPRMDYFKFVALLTHSEFVVSDGGSNQEECYYLGKPILLLRKATERHDGLGENCILSEFDQDIVDKFISNVSEYVRPPVIVKALPSDIIVDSCKKYYG